MPHKETRTIIRIGGSSLGVILPRDWLRYYDLYHKDKVEVVSNGEIIIKPIGGKK